MVGGLAGRIIADISFITGIIQYRTRVSQAAWRVASTCEFRAFHPFSTTNIFEITRCTFYFITSTYSIGIADTFGTNGCFMTDIT
jgi:hypothetical protein